MRTRSQLWPALAAGALVFVVVVTVSVVATRGGSGAPSGPGGYPSLSSETFVGRISVLPVPDTLLRTITVSAGDAVTAAEQNGFPEHMRPVEPDVGLGLVSYDVTGGSPVEEGTLDTSYRDRVAWVVVYLNSPPDLHGPADQMAKTPRYTCNLVLVVDAVTGADVIDAQQVCQQ